MAAHFLNPNIDEAVELFLDLSSWNSLPPSFHDPSLLPAFLFRRHL